MAPPVDLAVVGAGIAGFKFGPSMGRALADVIRGADFAASPLAPFAVDRDTRVDAVRGEHGSHWDSFV